MHYMVCQLQLYLTVTEGGTSLTTDNIVLYAVIGVRMAMIVVVAIFGLLFLRKK